MSRRRSRWPSRPEFALRDSSPYDDSLELVPVPVLIVERVGGSDLESERADAATHEHVWEQLGRDLARLHAGVDPGCWPGPEGPGTHLVTDVSTDMAQLVEERTAEGWFSYVESAWIARWVAQLGPLTPALSAATHGDIQMSNVLARDGEYAALIDWGCAARKDPVVDFMPLPLAAVPAMLRGHREIAPLPDDDNAERRILLGRLHTLLAVLPRGAAPRMTWGERPIAWLTDLLRFFQQPPTRTWKALAPPA